MSLHNTSTFAAFEPDVIQDEAVDGKASTISSITPILMCEYENSSYVFRMHYFAHNVDRNTGAFSTKPLSSSILLLKPSERKCESMQCLSRHAQVYIHEYASRILGRRFSTKCLNANSNISVSVPYRSLLSTDRPA